MAGNERFSRLNGSQEMLVSENGDCVAHIKALANDKLRGVHVSLESAQSVDRESLGMAIVRMGLAVLHMADSLEYSDVLDIDQLVRDLIEAYAPTKPDETPF